MKSVFAILLLFCAAPVIAQEASCTYTYTQYSRKIVKICRGDLPIPEIHIEDRVALMSGKAKSCVISAEFDRATKKGRVAPAVCK